MKHDIKSTVTSKNYFQFNIKKNYIYDPSKHRSDINDRGHNDLRL